MNHQVRKIIKNRGHFPQRHRRGQPHLAGHSAHAEEKQTVKRAKERGRTQPEPTPDGRIRATTVQGWKQVLNQFAIAHPDRIPTTP